MPEKTEEKKKEPMVELDTSGPGADVELPADKVTETTETEVEVKDDQETKTTEDVAKPDDAPAESDKQPDVQTSQPQDQKLEEYSKGVQGRISKLTRRMRESERREKAAVEYAQAVESNRQAMESRFQKVDKDYVAKLESSVNSGLEAAQKELGAAIEAGDAKAQVEANKRIATLSFDHAKLLATKAGKEEETVAEPRLSHGGYLPEQTPKRLPDPDPKAETWAGQNRWFGHDRAMTFTAFEIHKDLVDKEGFDPKTDDYYEEINKRIRVDFPHKFDKSETRKTFEPVQTVASATRSVKPGRQTVRLTPSQVAIAKKLGVPLEEYAKQLKLTKEA
jgi:hypothetical protein